MIAEVSTKEKLYTIEEYFKREELANVKSEYRNGKLIAILSGSYKHSRIIMNISGTLFGIVDNDDYSVVTSDHQIQIPQFNHFVYSDTCVVKGEPEFYKGANQGLRFIKSIIDF